jgi:hypothetical protein
MSDMGILTNAFCGGLCLLPLRDLLLCKDGEQAEASALLLDMRRDILLTNRRSDARIDRGTLNTQVARRQNSVGHEGRREGRLRQLEDEDVGITQLVYFSQIIEVEIRSIRFFSDKMFHAGVGKEKSRVPKTKPDAFGWDDRKSGSWRAPKGPTEKMTPESILCGNMEQY